MTKLTEEQIKDIAQQLDCGLSCHVNIKTSELLFIPDTKQYADEDLDAWADDLKKIKKDKKNYRTIDPPNSSDSFNIMPQFIKTLPDDLTLTDILTKALTKRKPFQEFKFAIDNSGDNRQKWFDFKDQMLVQWVKNELKYIDDQDE